MIGIYKITSPSYKIYIGQSVNIEKRFVRYKNIEANKGQSKLYNSFKKYGVENHKFEIIQTCQKKSLNKKEIFWISFYNCFNTQRGLNLKSGGEGGYCADETKKKIAKARTNTKKSEESKIKNRIASTGRVKSRKSIEKGKRTRKRNNLKSLRETGIRKYKFKRKARRDINGKIVVSKKTRKKMSKAKLGSIGYWRNKKKTQEQIDKCKRTNCVAWNKGKKGYRIHSQIGIENMKGNDHAIRRPILQLDLKTGEQIIEYISISEAARIIKGSVPNLVSCLKGKSQTAYGFKWKYKQ